MMRSAGLIEIKFLAIVVLQLLMNVHSINDRGNNEKAETEDERTPGCMQKRRRESC